MRNGKAPRLQNGKFSWLVLKHRFGKRRRTYFFLHTGVTFLIQRSKIPSSIYNTKPRFP